MLTFLSALFVVGIILFVSKLRRANISTQKCVYIVVLGDLGRSPRMCNHAIEFSKHDVTRQYKYQQSPFKTFVEQEI